MTVKAALSGAAMATFGFLLTAGTVSSATQMVTGIAGLLDDRDDEQVDGLRQDFVISLLQGDASALSGPEVDPMTGYFGDREEAALQPGTPGGKLAGAAPAGGAERFPDSSAAGRAANTPTVTPDSAAENAAPSTLAQMVARLVEFSANAAGRSAAP